MDIFEIKEERLYAGPKGVTRTVLALEKVSPMWRGSRGVVNRLRVDYLDNETGDEHHTSLVQFAKWCRCDVTPE